MRRSGFTLIELIISTGIIMMVIATTMPAFLAFQYKQNLVSAAQAVRDMILETQNLALAPRADVDGVAGKIPGADLYRIVFLSGTIQGYEIDEQSNTTDSSPTWTPVKQGTLPTGISFCSFSNSNLVSTEADPLLETQKGLVYSISQLGKITKPTTSGSLTIVINHKSLTEQEKIIIGPQTGRVDIELSSTPSSCS
jgi:type II secretory pathway pseudopilin PulG